jgi:hypothetical protein
MLSGRFDQNRRASHLKTPANAHGRLIDADVISVMINMGAVGCGTCALGLKGMARREA